jgi:hypothetical protein
MPTPSDWKLAAHAWFDGAPDDHQRYALVDLANVRSDKRQTLATLHARQSHNILGDERPDAQEASAWLMPLGLDARGRRDFDVTLEWADQSACVTWLHSALPRDALAHALSDRTKAVLPDDYRVLLRCYDPRVLPEIQAVLHEDQAMRYWALSGQWAYVDRARTFRLIELAPASPLAVFEAPLTLTQLQADRLLAAAEVDTVMPELVRESPEAFLAVPVTDRVAMTRRMLQTADQFRLEALADRVMFCVLTLELGDGFESTAKWAAVMGKVKHRQLTLGQAIEQAIRK